MSRKPSNVYYIDLEASQRVFPDMPLHFATEAEQLFGATAGRRPRVRPPYLWVLAATTVAGVASAFIA